MDEDLDLRYDASFDEEPSLDDMEEDDEGQGTYADERVQDAAQELHLQYLRHENPEDDEYEDAYEEVERARVLHQLVEVEEHQCHE